MANKGAKNDGPGLLFLKNAFSFKKRGRTSTFPQIYDGLEIFSFEKKRGEGRTLLRKKYDGPRIFSKKRGPGLFSKLYFPKIRQNGSYESYGWSNNV